MRGTIIHEKHPCPTPRTNEQRAGTLWQCDVCYKVWEAQADVGQGRVTWFWTTVADPSRDAALAEATAQQHPAVDAALRDALTAWTLAGPMPDYHEQMRHEVRRRMPLLGGALDRAASAEGRAR